jgi:3-oxoadipate CoA-transferase alpha subunit
MCAAAKETIVQTRSIVPVGKINPENVITPGIYVNKVVEIINPLHESELIELDEKYPW